MSSTTILGLPVSAGLPSDGDYMVSPYSLMCVVKAMDSDGDEVYAVLTSDSITSMDMAGMARFASLYADNKLAEQIRVASD